MKTELKKSLEDIDELTSEGSIIEDVFKFPKMLGHLTTSTDIPPALSKKAIALNSLLLELIILTGVYKKKQYNDLPKSRKRRGLNELWIV